MSARFNGFFIGTVLFIPSVVVWAGEPALRPWADNSWYWSYRGAPVLLLGGSDDDNLFQWPEEELVAQLDRLSSGGGNVIRNTMSDRKDKGFEIYPHQQREDGEYDLNRWNEAYWTRFERLLRETTRRAIIVQIEIWDRFDHPDLYDFVDVSQNNHNSGEKHWDNFLYVKKYLSKNPRPMNTTKTYGASGNKFGHTDQDAIERFWRHLLGGAASIRFHRPPSGLGLNDKALAAILAARKLESFIPLWSVETANELLSQREENEAYLAADLGRFYAIYFPAGGEVQLDVSAAKGALTIHWIKIDSGDLGPVRNFQGGDKILVTTPGPGNWAGVMVSDN
jgi:hypothetical protein